MTNIVSIPHNFTPRPYQLALYQAMDGIRGKKDSGVKRAVLRWARRAGKDKACWCYMVKQAAQVPGNYFYIFPTKTMARQALWENIDGSGFKLLNHIPKEFIARKSNQEMIVELNNNSTIRVLGYDKDPDSIRGVACKGAVFSEFAFSDPSSYKNMMPSLRESGGWVIFNSTPNGRNHFYDLWQSVCTNDRWFTSIVQTLWPEGEGYVELIPPEAISEVTEEEGLSQEDVEREYGVSFSSGLKGSYYIDVIEKAWSAKRIGDFVYDERYPVYTYWDLGIEDTTACWFAQEVGNTVTFIDYFEGNNMGTDDLARMLENKGYRYETHYIPHDGGRRLMGREVIRTSEEFEESLAAFQVTGDVYVLEKAHSIQAGILAVRKRFAVYRFDLTNCRDGLSHLELYHRKYDKRKQAFLPQPFRDAHTHAADALRMEAESKEDRNNHFVKLNKLTVNSEYDVWE